MKEGQHGNITGNLQIKNGKYYVLVNLYDYTGKRTIKWVALGLDRKCGKKLARARMNEVLDEYNRSQERLMRAVSKKSTPNCSSTKGTEYSRSRSRSISAIGSSAQRTGSRLPPMTAI